MSLPNEVNSSFLGAGGGQQYRIERSVRIRSSASAYFAKSNGVSTISTPTDTNYYKKTYSFWIKRSKLGVIQHIITNSFDVNNRWQIDFNASDQIFIFGINAGSYVLNINSLASFRDTSAWYHIVISVDVTLAAAADRIKLYINGSQQALTGTLATQNSAVAGLFLSPSNGTWYTRIGNEAVNGSGLNQLDGYISEINAIDGQALPASSFGEIDMATGVWKPKRYSGSYGNNGFKLNFNSASLSTELQLSATASVGAPGLAPGSSADFAKVIDSSSLSTNVTTGANFDVIKYDLGSVQQITRFYAGGLYFSGATTTNSRLLYSQDDVTYKVATPLAVNTTSTNFSGNLNIKARYVKINIDGFGVNGRGFLESFILYQDGIGLDTSGNGNNFTPNNISVTPGVTYDSMFDVPTSYADGNNGRGNYCVLNPLNQRLGSNLVNISGGNLNIVYSTGGATAAVLGNIVLPSGKWFAEVVYIGGTITTAYVGVLRQDYNNSSPSNTGQVMYIGNGNKRINGVDTAYGAAFVANDIIGIAVDTDAGTAEFFKNNVSQGVISAPSYIQPNLLCFGDIQGNGNDALNHSWNFGQRPFTYTPPAGFKALHTGNLPTPTIGASNSSQAKNYFNSYTYTGTGNYFYKYGSLPKRSRADSRSTVSKSLRFRNGSYLTRASIAGATPTKWGMSFWVKPGTGGAVYSSGSVQNGVYETYAAVRVFTNRIDIWDVTNTGNYPLNLVANYNLNSDNWYHIVISCDTTLSTASDRIKLFIDNKRITNFSTFTYYATNTSSRFNSNLTRYIGRLPADGYGGNSWSHFNGYLADFHFIDGSGVVPGSFGQYNTDGIWVPSSYQGVYGPAGWRLNFSDATSAATLCYDISGNLNNWTASGISVASNASYDSMTDVPCDYDDGFGERGNYATLSHYVGSYETVSDGMLTFDTGAYGAVVGNFLLSSGKWYWEVTPTSASTNAQRYVGILGVGLGFSLYYWVDGRKEINGAASAYGSAYTTGSVIGVALDLDAKTVKFYKDSVYQGPISLSQSGQYTCVSACGGNAASNGYYNFGQRPFSYAPPAGYKSINTYNFTSPSTFWWGDGTGTIPDLLWIKNRVLSGSANRLMDSTRGFTYGLTSNSGEAESPVGIGRIDKFGIGFNGDTNVNGATQSHAMWAWKEDAGAKFDVVSYYGTGTAGLTVNHNLGVKPSMIIIKNRSATNAWVMFHSALDAATGGNGAYLTLSSTAAKVDTTTGDAETVFGNGTQWVTPSSSSFTVGNWAGVNGSGNLYVAYCWAEVAGYSKFGSYVGNGSTDGPFVYCGFRPRWVMIKKIEGGNWQVLDTTRNTYNVANSTIFPNDPSVEANDANRMVDFLSNGFKIRSTTGATTEFNGSGSNFIFTAFAETPFKYSLAR